MRYMLAVLAFLGGCATTTSPVPQDYKGPVVSLADTGAQEDSSKGRFFAILELDGRPIMNALRETRGASYGHGFALTSRFTTRDIPARPSKVKLIGTHQTAAPIHEMASRVAGTFFSVEGIVSFNPTQGRSYEVTGELGKELSCVWIVDAGTKQPATEKVCTK